MLSPPGKVLRVKHNESRPVLGGRYTLYKALDSVIGQQRGFNVLLFLTADEMAAQAQVGLRNSDHAFNDLGRRIAVSLRQDEQLFRFSNAEYAVILAKNNATAARDAVSRLRKDLSGQRFATTDGHIELAINTGMYHLRGSDNAEHAVIQARRAASRTDAQTQEDSFEALMDDGELWRARIQQALKQDRILLVYQSLVPLNQDAPEHYDVLLRMIDAEDREIPPNRFLPASGSSGAMPLVDRWVLRRTLELLQARARDQLTTAMFVRLSEASLTRCGAFLNHLGKELSHFRIPNQKLIISIPAAILRDNIKYAAKLSEGLAGLGCHLAIDRFAPDESCRQLLAHLSVDYVKLDPTLVADVTANEAAITECLHAARDHGAASIIPQVEHSEDLVALAKLGPDFLQGYIIQQPALTMVSPPVDDRLRQAAGFQPS